MWNVKIILLSIAISWAFASASGHVQKRAIIVHRDDQDSESECTFGNFYRVISHNKFSLLLLLPDCRVYYIDGERMKPSFEINKLFSSNSEECKDSKAKFFRTEDMYKVLVSDFYKKTMTTIDDPWTEVQPGVYSVVFDSKLHDHSSICLPNEKCVMKNVFTDAKEHFAYTIVYLKAKGGLRMLLEFTLPDMKLSHSRNFSDAENNGDFKHVAYDSDMKVLYFYRDSVWFSQKVGDGEGTSKFNFFSTTKVVSHDPEFRDSSFSNNYYLAEKESSVRTLHVGGSMESRCVWRANKSDEHLSFELFVSTSYGASVHDSIRRQIVGLKGKPKTNGKVSGRSRSSDRKRSSASATGSSPLTIFFLIAFSISACFRLFS